MLMCYHIINHTGKFLSRSALHRLTNLELSTDEVKETFVKFDAEIHRRLNTFNKGYEGSKPSPNIWRICWKKIPTFLRSLKGYSIMIIFQKHIFYTRDAWRHLCRYVDNTIKIWRRSWVLQSIKTSARLKWYPNM